MKKRGFRDSEKEDITVTKLIYYNIIFFAPIIISLFIANLAGSKLSRLLEVSPHIASRILMIFLTLIIFLFIIPYIRKRENVKGVRYALIGFLIVGISYQGTLVFCILFAAIIIPLSLMLDSGKRKKLSIADVLALLDFRRRSKVFRIFFVLSFLRGLATGFWSGFVLPLFLKGNGFGAQTIGLLLGLQALIAGASSYVFARESRLKKLILTSGVLYTLLFTLLGLSVSIFSGLLIIFLGVVEGLLAVVNEGVLPRITKRESYGSDIGLLMLGLHVGLTLSLAISGFLISSFGFVLLFVFSALVLIPEYVISYVVLKE